MNIATRFLNHLEILIPGTGDARIMTSDALACAIKEFEGYIRIANTVADLSAFKAMTGVDDATSGALIVFSDLTAVAFASDSATAVLSIDLKELPTEKFILMIGEILDSIGRLDSPARAVLAASLAKVREAS